MGLLCVYVCTCAYMYVCAYVCVRINVSFSAPGAKAGEINKGCISVERFISCGCN